MNALITLVRAGEITVGRAGYNRNQCGVRGSRVFAYRVEISCSSAALDKQGFVIDQLKVHKLLHQRYAKVGVFPSCEQMALDAAHFLCRQVADALRVKVSVGMAPAPQSFITAEVVK